jgi:subtilisin family serine protease
MARFPTFLLVLSLLVALGASAQAASGRVLVSFEPGTRISVDKSADGPRTGVSGLDVVLARHGATSLEPLFGDLLAAFDDPAVRADLARHYVLRHANKSDDEAVNADLRALAMVEDSATDRPLSHHGSAYMPDDLAGVQWYLRNTSLGGGDSRALGGWAESLGDSTVVVAVCDTGIDWHHPDLGGPHPDKVNGALWTNWAEYHGSPGVDDDGNGFVDDIRGWDFVSVSAGQVYPGEDPGPPDNDPMDFNGHGTLVAGCVAPITDNGIGIAATAPGCKVMALRIGWHTPDGNGVAYPSYMAQAFLYAVANGADIINLSYGTSYYSPFQSAINTALNAGLVICVSAGNDNDQNAGYLQAFADDRVLTVAASNSSDGKADFSSFGTWVDVTAPGKNIYTTAYSFQSGESTYSSTQGTSFASPITAGACALIWSARPELTSAEVAALVQDTCDDIDHLNPTYEGLLGHGRINLLRALGDTVHQVPQEFTHLQDAINMAAAGDEVRVLASEPLGAFVVQKEVTVAGGYAADYETRDPVGTPTVVDAASTGPALEFFGPITANTVVDGFRLQNGIGRTFSDIPYAGKYGGGVVISNQSPTLRNLVVTGNAVGSSTQLGCGGGILLHNSDAVLEDITITENTAILGGGLFIYQGSPTLARVVIEDNVLSADNVANPPRGGGVHVLDATVALTDVEVRGHLGATQGGGIYVGQVTDPATLLMTGGEVSGNTAKANGGGIVALGGGALELTDVVIADNGPTPDATFMSGGAVFADGVSVSIDGGEVLGNSAQSGGGVQMTNSPAIDLANVVLGDNASLIFGGTVYVTASTQAVLTNLTVAANSSVSGGAGINVASTPLTVTNTISAFNTGGTATANGINVSNTTPVLSCNDVFGNEGMNYGGVADPTGTDGNISADPLFCDLAGGDYAIEDGSPCAAGQSGGCGLIGALSAGCGGVSPVEDAPAPAAFAVEQNFPNPFNPVTTIRFALPQAARTTVTVFDVRGRLVKTLVDAELAAAQHAVQWRGDDAGGRAVSAGIYFYRVISGDHQAVGRMALIK